MPATSSAPGAQPEAVKRPKVKRKPKPPPTTTVNATLGGAGVAATERAASRAERDVTPPEIEAVASGKSVQRVKKERKAKKARQEAAALKKLLKVQKANDLDTYNVEKFQRVAERDLKTGKVTPDPRPMSAADLTGETARRVSRHGAVGEISPKVAATGRQLLYGSKDPSVLEVAAAIAPLPAWKAAKAGQTILRGGKVLRTADKAADAKKVAKAAKVTRKQARKRARGGKKVVTPKGAKATADQMGKNARARLAKQEARAAAKRAAQRAADRTVRSVTSPVVAGMAASPGEIGDRTRAFIEGTKNANVGQSAKTTLGGIPALFAYGATVASALPDAATGNPKPLAAAGKQGVEALKQLEPYVSGDAEAVEHATEEESGYVFAPLAPKGIFSKPAKAGAKATGRGIARTVEEVAKPVKAARNSRPVVRVVPKRPQKTKPGPIRKAKQVIVGTGDRKKMAQIADRSMGKAGREASIAAKGADKPAAKLGKRHGPEAESLAVVMHVHGVSDTNTMAQLDRILDDHRAHPDDPHIANERKAIEWAKNHPEVFEDKHLWQTVDRAREYTDPMVTSESSKFVNQGRVAGTVPRHEMVPAAARPLTDANTRKGAWDDVRELKSEARELKTKARESRARAKEAKGQRRQQLIQQARVFERGSKRRQGKADELEDILEPYSRPGAKPSPATKRIDWDAEMNERFMENVRSERHPDANDPGWASDKTPHDMVGDLGGPQVQTAGPRAPRTKSGSAGAQDIADRSFAGFLVNSVRGPRMQRGVNEFVRGVIKEFKVKVPGTDRYVVKSAREANELIADGLLDPREFVFVPIRHVKQSVKAEKFDLGGYHTELMDTLNAEINGLESTRGTKYVIMRRENAIEFADQLNPEIGGLEGFLGGAATVGSRAILGTNPAWLEAQFVNELTQAAVAVNPGRILRARQTLYRFAKQHPRAAEDFRAFAGDSPSSLESLNKTHQRGVPNPADAYEAYRFSRQTIGAQVLDDILHFRALGKVDKAKSGAIRSHTLAAAIDRELNSVPAQARREVKHFFRGLAGAQDLEYRMAKELQGLSRPEQLRRWTEDPRLHGMRQEHLNYLDDVIGNWTAFTRFERRFAPVTMFYPYLRMSLRWTFSSYPKRHPIKAQLLYLLGQQNNEELEKLLGRGPSFYESSFPVVRDEEGRLDEDHGGVLPGGARFGAPGGNFLVESMGSGKVSGLGRGLNPLLQMGAGAIWGLDTYTGEKAKKFEGSFGQQLRDRGMAAAQQLLSLPGPLRTGIGPFPELGNLGEEQSGASKGFDTLDPAKDERSILNPFIGLSAEKFKTKSDLSRSFEQTDMGPESEAGQLYDMVETYGYDKTMKMLKRQAQGKIDIAESEVIPDLPETDDPQMDEVFKLYYKLKDKASKASKKSSRPKVRVRPTTDSVFGGATGTPIFGGSGASGSSIFESSGGQPLFK